MADKGDEQQEAEGQCHPAPIELRELGEPEHREDHGQAVEQRAASIDALDRLFAPLLMQVELRRDDAGQAGRRDEDEDALPARIVVQEAAEHRAAGKPHVDHRDHPAKRAPALLRREAQRDDGHVRRVEHRRRHALQCTRHEQEAHIRRHDAERRRQCEEDCAPEEDAPLAEAVCQLAHRQQEDDGGEQEDLEHPAEFVGRGAVIPPDVRQ